MGIVHLNRFLVDNCKRSTIKKIKLNELANKTIAIDTSIYLYKYLHQNALFENFYSMISLFRNLDITPIFVFDGKPPPEKYELLDERKAEKADAEQKYKALETQLQEKGDDLSPEDKKMYLQEIEELKSQCIRVKNKDIQHIKTLMKTYNVPFIESKGEADEICASLVLSGKAWACMSDDMDMFVYGCTRVLRHFSLNNKTVLLYNFTNILNDLNMDMQVFRQITVLSGTDYNIHSNTSLHETMKWYEEYIKGKQTIDFYDWLVKHTKYINDAKTLNTIYQMFCLKETQIQQFYATDFEVGQYDEVQLHNLLEEHGFVFPNHENS
jgi:hypothetical protein